jgi:hypothetical protein
MCNSEADSVDRSATELSLVELAGIISDSEAEEMRDALRELRVRSRDRIDLMTESTAVSRHILTSSR